jgi:hypothetical protein
MARGPVRERWWERATVLLAIVVTIWLLVGALAIPVGWFLPEMLGDAVSFSIGPATYTFLDGSSSAGAGVAVTCLNIMLCLGVVGIMVQVLQGIRADNGPAWGLAYFGGIPLLGIGLAGTVRFALAGRVVPVLLLAIVLGVARLRGRRHAAIREQVRLSGVRTRARVARVDLTNRNDVHYWKTWLEYSDTDGEQYHVTHLAPFLSAAAPVVGREFAITYDPAHPGKRSHVVVHGPAADSPAAPGTKPRTDAHCTAFVQWRGKRR